MAARRPIAIQTNAKCHSQAYFNRASNGRPPLAECTQALRAPFPPNWTARPPPHPHCKAKVRHMHPSAESPERFDHRMCDFLTTQLVKRCPKHGFLTTQLTCQTLPQSHWQVGAGRCAVV